MGEIDQPHDAEDQRQAGRVERVEAAEEDALNDGVDPAESCHMPEIGGVDGVAGQLAGTARQRHPAFLEAIDAVGDGERLDDVLLDDDEARPLAP